MLDNEEFGQYSKQLQSKLGVKEEELYSNRNLDLIANKKLRRKSRQKIRLDMSKGSKWLSSSETEKTTLNH